MTDIKELRRLAEAATSALMPVVPAANPQTVLSLIDRIERLEKALERLGSSEAMTISFCIDKSTNEGAELVARIDYALAALKETT